MTTKIDAKMEPGSAVKAPAGHVPGTPQRQRQAPQAALSVSLHADAMEAASAAQDARTVSTKVVFLTVNDVYELYPGVNGVGGLAELATLLRTTRAQLPRDAHVVTTLNGDFLWRSELDRPDKGAHMVQLLNRLGIQYVVLGNHEFDFGAETARELLQGADFTCLGSNVRCADAQRSLFPSVTDTCVVPLSNGLHLGLFGLVTPATGRDPFAGPSVVFDSELVHAQRCVQELQARGADAIVALTHLKVADDERVAGHTAGLHLVLGGHDHFPLTRFAHGTLIHKSGMDALWLGIVEMTLTAVLPRAQQPTPAVEVAFQWHMRLNRGCRPDVDCLALLDAYRRRVEQDEASRGLLEPLATSHTALDGRRTTCRTQESNLGNLVADALREELQADVGLVNAGYLKGDALHAPGLVLTRKWLETFLPLVKPTVVLEMTVGELQAALGYWLRRQPAMSSSQPHVSGLRVTYDMSSVDAPAVTSLRLVQARQDGQAHAERLVTVAMPLLSSMDGWSFFADKRQVRSGPMVRTLVESFVRRRRELRYKPQEGRMRLVA